MASDNEDIVVSQWNEKSGHYLRAGFGSEPYYIRRDTNYANKDNDRRSVSGIAVTLGSTVVSHGSSTQLVVQLSTSEAEHIAAGDGSKEALFVRAGLYFIAPETCGASVKVLEDNQGTKTLIENSLSSTKSKHIGVRFHFIREHFKAREISGVYVASAEQHAIFSPRLSGGPIPDTTVSI